MCSGMRQLKKCEKAESTEETAARGSSSSHTSRRAQVSSFYDVILYGLVRALCAALEIRCSREHITCKPHYTLCAETGAVKREGQTHTHCDTHRRSSSNPFFSGTMWHTRRAHGACVGGCGCCGLTESGKRKRDTRVQHILRMPCTHNNL